MSASRCARRGSVAGERARVTTEQRESVVQRKGGDVRGVDVARGVTQQQQEHGFAEHVGACAVAAWGATFGEARSNGKEMGRGGALVRAEHAGKTEGGGVRAVK